MTDFCQRQQDQQDKQGDREFICESSSSEESIAIPGRKYRHKKGNVYEVLYIAKHSETGDELVIYKAIGHAQVFARPRQMFEDGRFIADQEIERLPRDSAEFTHLIPPKLSAEARKVRKPPPPDVLVEGVSDRVGDSCLAKALPYKGADLTDVSGASDGPDHDHGQALRGTGPGAARSVRVRQGNQAYVYERCSLPLHPWTHPTDCHFCDRLCPIWGTHGHLWKGDDGEARAILLSINAKSGDEEDNDESI